MRIAINGEFIDYSFPDPGRFIYSILDIGYNTLTSCTYKFAKWTLDDYCVIKGKALWTENFTPPTIYLPDKW